MSRPEFPNFSPLTPEIIQRIRAEQQSYDQDPDRYEEARRLAQEECDRAYEAAIEDDYMRARQEYYERTVKRSDEDPDAVDENFDLPF